MSSFIDDIEKLTEKQRSFVANSQEVNAQSLANYMFSGQLNVAKNKQNSNVRKMLSSFALEIIRKEKAIQTVADQYYPFNTVDFLEEWEDALGIPDDCFKVVDVSLDQRQRQVVAKLAIDKIITRDDFIALAAFFGYTITIEYGYAADSFPMTFPFILDSPDSSKAKKFTIVITFYGITPTGSFPYTFPLTFAVQIPFEFLQCLIKKLVPANVSVIFRESL